MSERDMQQLIALLERQIGVKWADIVEWLRSQNTLEEIEQKLATGRLEDVIADVSSAAEKFAADLHAAYITSGQTQAAWLDAKVPDVLIHFDAASPQVVAAARRNSLEQVGGLTQESRDTIRQVLVDGARSGANPRVTAQRIRDSIGLAPPQEQALANYRAALESGDYTKALGYELSSGHSDRTIAAARTSGRALTQGEADLAVDRYRQNSINQRAETIARTEALRAAHEGSRDAIGQAIDRGDIEADALEKNWNPGPKTRYSRPDHQEMGRRSPIPVLDDFVLPDGTRMSGPGDPRGGAKHCANCECCSSTRFRSP